jgi:AmiR/NasT family two-component response regulator
VAESSELDQLARYADAQERKVGELQTTVGQLQSALDSRVVIERAIGMLAERFDLTIPEAFELLRSAARSSRRRLSELAEEMIESRGWTPDEVVIARRRRDPS